ncbi:MULTISPECIES: winged helix-turn-helix domain-containing protein [unclassified Beijerinckia]|uniref:transcriptional regulator n=1 Tax=unclassified Beijerinckia TaxID=2638183 RepID=UPI001FCD22C6|nr:MULTISPECIES: winged helix-turn-helix domain-containing protein [unclassified Beijerinckia]MDH7794007.1 hypothetical protein [Beijerinckia sp. GAS462]
MLATNPGRVLSKHELMATPNIHVSEDSLFQCIREVRAALGDDKRTMIRVISGRGYLFEAEVLDATALDTTTLDTIASAAPGEAAIGPSADVTADPPITPQTKSEPVKRRFDFSLRRGVALVAAVGLASLSLAVIQPPQPNHEATRSRPERRQRNGPQASSARSAHNE